MAVLGDDDLKAIKTLIEVTLDEKLDEKLDAKLTHLPTKDEFYEQTGKILKKLDDLEQEKDAISHRVSNHEDRITNLETHVRHTTD